MKITDLQKTENGLQYLIYKALQYRWEETDNPEREDETYHLTYEEAEKAASEISLNIGFYPVVESLRVDIKNVEFDEESEFDLCELDNYRKYYGDIETVWEGSACEGALISDAIIIEWSWEKYPGYCRNLLNVGIAGEFPFHEFKKESDLITGNEERTFRSNYSILLTSEEVSEADNLQIAIEDALSSDNWKWNYFKKNPSSQFISDRIEEIANK